MLLFLDANSDVDVRLGPSVARREAKEVLGLEYDEFMTNEEVMAVDAMMICSQTRETRFIFIALFLTFPRDLLLVMQELG
mmetsp:Transcript_19296/g.41887  ORF Transcript_19296/g.41887 Transcript_19296/m.41887 type:complete len:80 (-) Transcript_19296:116-355(-)